MELETFEPSFVDMTFDDKLFVKAYTIDKIHSILPQHKHVYSHVSFIATGSVRIWQDDVLLGDFHAPTGVVIEAHKFHRFLTLTPSTTILCIHNISDAEGIEVEEHNSL